MEILKQFANHLRQQDLSEKTVASYLRDLKDFAQWLEHSGGDKLSPQTITPIDVKEYRSYLVAVKERKPATINRRLAAISKFCRWGMEQGLIDADPASGIARVESVRLAPKALNKNDLYRLLRTVQKEGTPRDIAIFEVLRNTGIRVGELCNLRLSDILISERRGTLTVRQGKGRKMRLLALNVDARKALSAYLQVRPKVDHDFLFVGQRGDRMSTRAVQHVVKKYAQKAGLEGVTPHTFRHTLGTLLVQGLGEDLVTVATILGHKRLDTTRIYTQPSEADIKRALDKVAMEE